MRISWFGLLLAAGLAVRVAALPLPGTEDVTVWKVWSYNAARDVTAVYGIGGNPPERRMLQYHRMATPVDYPPVALYELSRVYHVLDDRGWQAFFLPVARIMALSTFIEQGMPNPRRFANAAVLIVVGWALWRVRRSGDLAMHAAFAAFTVHTFFVLAVGVHEHHQVLAVPMLALAAALRPGFRRIFVAVSLICALNMHLFYGISRGWGWAVPRMITPIDLSVLLSLANIAALVWHARVLAREAARATADSGDYADGAYARMASRNVSPRSSALRAPTP